jgi:hypothetical protein
MIKFILIVVVLIVAFPFIAKLIVDYVPKKFHWIISLALLVTAIFLGYKIYDGVMGNIKFHQEKKKRYAKVIDKLKVIREAEIAYKRVKGDYTKNFDTLVNFIEKDSFPVLRTYEKTKKIVERGVEREIEFKVVDTIGFTKVIESFKNKDYRDMAKVPGTNVNFDIATGYVLKGQAEIKTPVFEVKVPKKVVLEGMDKDLIDQEINQYAVDQVRGEYISVGTLEDVKDSGNWPPTYDTKEDTDTE